MARFVKVQYRLTRLPVLLPASSLSAIQLAYTEQNQTVPNGHLRLKNPDVTDTELLAIGTFTIESGYASTCQLEQNSFVQDGTTYYGILDPSTGKPVETDLVSVTVTHADGPTSDALCPCLYGIGKRKGMSLLEQYNAGGIFIDRENNVTVTDNLKESVQLTTDTFKLA